MGHWFGLTPADMGDLTFEQWAAMFAFLDANTK